VHHVHVHRVADESQDGSQWGDYENEESEEAEAARASRSVAQLLHTATWPYDIVARFWDTRPLPEHRECCSKHPTEDYIDWNQCAMQYLMAPNFTETGLQQVASSGGLQSAAKLVKTGTC
jgi:hypothetical protein